MITIRLMTKQDLPFLLEVRNHETTRVNLENNSIFSLEECEKWFETLKSPWYIIENDKNESVGYLRTNGDEIGCDIYPDFRRMGYAKNAYEQYLKDKKFASLWVFEDNFAKKLYENLGFIEDGYSKIIRNRKYVRMIYEK